MCSAAQRSTAQYSAVQRRAVHTLSHIRVHTRTRAYPRHTHTHTHTRTHPHTSTHARTQSHLQVEVGDSVVGVNGTSLAALGIRNRVELADTLRGVTQRCVCLSVCLSVGMGVWVGVGGCARVCMRHAPYLAVVVDISAVRHEQLDDLEAAFPSCILERRLAILGGVDG